MFFIEELLQELFIISWRQVFSRFDELTTDWVYLTAKFLIGIMPARDFVFPVFNQMFVKVFQPACHFSPLFSISFVFSAIINSSSFSTDQA